MIAKTPKDHENKGIANSGRALAGVKVLEYGSFAAAPYCGKLMADLGAEVIKIEEPERGDEARRWGRFPDDVPHPEKSALFLYLNTNKLGITLNLNTTAGQGIFKKLAETSDIVIEDNLPGLMENLGLSYPELKEVNRKLIMTSITPFGQNGPYSKHKAYYLNTYHSGLLGYISPFATSKPQREPLKIGGLAGEYTCGLSAAVATLSALYFQRLGGQGQHIDVSKQEVLIGFGRIMAAAYANGAPEHSRISRFTGRGCIVRCLDGYICIHTPEDKQWEALVKLMGNPEWAMDKMYTESGMRVQHFGDAVQHIEEWMSTRKKDEVCREAQELGCTATPVTTAEDLVNSPQSAARGLFAGIRHPEAGELEYPMSPFIFSKMPSAVINPAPLLGEHNHDIYINRMGYTPEDLKSMSEEIII